LNNLGLLWYNKKDFDKALDFYNQSFEIYKRIYQNQDHPNIAASLNNFGLVWNKKDFDKALDFYTQSFEMKKRLYSKQDHPDIILTMFNLTLLLCRSPLTIKRGIELLKQYKKIVTKDKNKQEIEGLLKKYDNVGRDKSKRKKK
jgi:tetratricopeptide (TPR) repeat protein